MSEFNREALSLHIRPSLQCAALLIACHGIGLATLAAAPMFHNVAGGFLAVTILALLTLNVLRDALLIGDRAICALHLSPERATLVFGNGEHVTAELTGKRMIALGLVALRFRIPRRGHRTVLLTRDSVSPEELRHLRVHCRFG